MILIPAATDRTAEELQDGDKLVFLVNTGTAAAFVDHS